MTIAVTHVTQAVSGSPGASSTNTAAISRAADRYYLVSVTSIRGSSLAPDSVTLTGWGVTWDLLVDEYWLPTGTNRRRTQLFGAHVSDAASAVLTMNYTNTPASLQWVVDYATDVDLTTPDVSSNRESGSGTFVGGSPSSLITFAALADVDNRTYTVAAINGDGSTSMTWDANYTLVGATTSTSAPTRKTTTAWRNSATPDLSPTMTTVGSWSAGQIGIELVQAAAPPSSSIKSVSGVAYAGVKTVAGVAIAAVKTVAGVA